MGKEFVITEYKGDFQVEDQPMWGQKFHYFEAVGKAMETYAYSRHIGELDCYVTIQRIRDGEISDEVAAIVTLAGLWEAPDPRIHNYLNNFK